jgi:hypothetical protein
MLELQILTKKDVMNANSLTWAKNGRRAVELERAASGLLREIDSENRKVIFKGKG